ncbi:RHS repeat domain-containing protein [Leptospira sp. mild_001]|uniref:RHS repeat domain-containing protein n=1 Tax=Leptospira sp. mild_001 TaxID=2838238 RepID=UPI001E4FA0D4|nr:RHS repeat domain-containing protein [Leptospira sp. mild_001]
MGEFYQVPTTTFTYNSLGRRVSTQDPNSGTISYSYDSLGRLYSQTDARGKTITFTYDLLGRPLTQATNGPEAPIQFTYDDASVPFSRGRLTKVTRWKRHQKRFVLVVAIDPFVPANSILDFVCLEPLNYTHFVRPLWQSAFVFANSHTVRYTKRPVQSSS